MSASLDILYPDNPRLVTANTERPIRVSVGQDTLRYGLTPSTLDFSLSAGQTVVFERAYWIQTDGDGAVVLQGFEEWDPDPDDGTGNSGADLRVRRRVPNNLRYAGVGAIPAKSSSSSGASITATETTLTVSGGDEFDGDDVGRDIVVEGAGAAGDNLVTTIASVDSETEAELTDAASTTDASTRAVWGVDAGPAFQKALDNGRPVEITDSYLVKTTIQLPAAANINGFNRARAGFGRLYFIGGATANCIESADENQSGVYIGNLDIRDVREGATDGDGIYLDAPKNAVTLERVWVFDFASSSSNCITITAGAGFNPDVITLRNVWATRFGQYGIHIQRPANQVLLDHISGDTSGNANADALIRVDTMGEAGQVAVVIQAVKFEAGGIAAHAIDIDGAGGLVTVNGAVMRAGTNAGGAVVRVTGTGTTVVAQGLCTTDSAGTGPGADCLFEDATAAVKYGDGLRRLPTIVRPGTSANTETPTIVGDLNIGGELEVDGALNHDGTTAGFYGTTPIAKATGVAVTAEGIHAALVNLGLIAA